MNGRELILHHTGQIRNLVKPLEPDTFGARELLQDLQRVEEWSYHLLPLSAALPEPVNEASNDEDREKLHRRVARKSHGSDTVEVTVQGLEDLRQAALNGQTHQRRKKAAETYKALTGAKP